MYTAVIYEKVRPGFAVAAAAREELDSPAGRERLRATILTAVRERVGPHVDEEAQTRFEIDDVLLTNLVMQ